MNFLKRIAILFNVSIVTVVSCMLILYSINLIEYSDLAQVLYAVYFDDVLGMIMLGVCSFLLVMNFIIFRLLSINIHRDKIIAFDNPTGRVSVSLVAMEDLVRRLIAKMPEVKDSKISIMATSKRGLDIKIKLILKSEVSIPELTSKMQKIVTRKIQDTIGMEENIEVTIYVGRIDTEKVKKSEAKSDPIPESDEEPNVPFHGYRA